jgi:transcriptional regulator with XRE-family HTH domain
MAASTVAEQMLWTSSTQVASFLRLVTAHEDAEAKRIGKLIAQLRLKQGWSQQDLAAELEMHVSTVSRWEVGKHEGYAKNVRKLAKALKVKPSVLRPTEPEFETQLDRVAGQLSELDEQVRLMRAEIAARDAEVLKRLDEGLPPTRRTRRQPPQ